MLASLGNFQTVVDAAMVATGKEEVGRVGTMAGVEVATVGVTVVVGAAAVVATVVAGVVAVVMVVGTVVVEGTLEVEDTQEVVHLVDVVADVQEMKVRDIGMTEVTNLLLSLNISSFLC